MSLHELLESNDGARVVSGVISSIRKSKIIPPILIITPHNSTISTVEVLLQKVTLEELGIKKTSPKYLKKKQHPVILYIPHKACLCPEVYDGITGKTIYTDRLSNQRKQETGARPTYNTDMIESDMGLDFIDGTQI